MRRGASRGAVPGHCLGLLAATAAASSLCLLRGTSTGRPYSLYSLYSAFQEGVHRTTLRMLRALPRFYTFAGRGE